MFILYLRLVDNNTPGSLIYTPRDYQMSTRMSNCSSEEEDSEPSIVSRLRKPGHNNNSNSNTNVSNTRKKHRKHYSLSSSTGWKKLLWLKQPYADNYTDVSFLSQLKRNSTVVKYSYRKLVSDFSLVVLHLSLIMSVIVVFYGTYRLNWNPLKPAILSTTLTFSGFIFYVVTLKIRRNKELIELQQLKIRQLYTTPTSKMTSSSGNLNSTILPDVSDMVDPDSFDLEEYLTEPSPPNFYETFKSSMLIILYLLTLSPVLKSLTNSTSSDSIWALSAWLSILNVMFNDYQIDFPKVSEKEKRSHWQKILKHNYSMLSSNQMSRSSSSSAIGTEDNDQYTNNSLPILSSNKNIKSNPSNLQNLNFAKTLSDLHNQNVHKSNFSKNIAVSNAIVLASRLQSNASAFSFILFCIEACGLFPIFNNFTRRCELQGFHYFQLTSIVLTVDIIVWYLFGLGWFIVWVSLHLMIVIIGPWYFLALQKYKDELQGPWDPAKPIVKSI